MPAIRNTVTGLKGRGPPGVRPTAAASPAAAPATSTPSALAAPAGPEPPAEDVGEDAEKIARTKAEKKAKAHLEKITPGKLAFEALKRDEKAPISKTDRTNQVKDAAARNIKDQYESIVTYAELRDGRRCAAKNCGPLITPGQAQAIQRAYLEAGVEEYDGLRSFKEHGRPIILLRPQATMQVLNEVEAQYSPYHWACVPLKERFLDAKDLPAKRNELIKGCDLKKLDCSELAKPDRLLVYQAIQNAHYGKDKIPKRRLGKTQKKVEAAEREAYRAHGQRDYLTHRREEMEEKKKLNEEKRWARRKEKKVRKMNEKAERELEREHGMEEGAASSSKMSRRERAKKERKEREEGH
ncbi:hypothetical protein GLOTRDRAFT_134281 [Gloeophyllum trabeum ATCC 11539]|uniref:Uncharacterized protein n=1 Tax=Gloeophyllum trabeum (strain ATCC 11539 / FP-39264 / Madison 617) TaxID=670483 RepID=S7PRR9_GLOTA|nr:uncharacterized protein GLOTRDRAFT_134281 [Gloeophyllum trabeum ATCC 11539]EPQ50072.1 hypothetical protein GLOTRDRAFT_134281 [Gloeophyllum trabeum ATCC 11539]